MGKKNRGSVAKRGRGPTRPVDWDRRVAELRAQVQLLESMYQRQMAAAMGLRSQLDQAVQTLIGAILATGDTEILLSKENIQAIAEYTGFTSMEDGDGNIVLKLVAEEDEDEDPEA